MAIAYASVDYISRGEGRSATGAAAYRAGMEIRDERTGMVHDYTRKQGILFTGMALPDDAPEWASDRATLWNAAEKSEKRKDARIAREIILALPHELQAHERNQLVMDYARFLSDRHGAAVDVAIHAPDDKGDRNNFHSHVLVSARRLGPEGFTEKTKELDDYKQGPKEIEAWWQNWQDQVNQALERAGYGQECQIDMRSYDRQGKNREGQKHVGPKWTEYERQTGEKSYRAQYNDAVKSRNAGRERDERELAEVEAQIIDLQAEREKRRLAQEEKQRQAQAPAIKEQFDQAREGSDQDEHDTAAIAGGSADAPDLAASFEDAARDPQAAPETDHAKTWDADQYHSDWQDAVNQAGIDHAMAEEQRQREEKRTGTGDSRARTVDRLATLEELEEWQGWQRADAQRDQHDRRQALDAGQGLKKHRQEELWFQSYGQYRQAEQRNIQEIEARQERGGLWYRWFRKAGDDQALTAYKASIANGQWRETQARDAFDKELQRAREKLEEKFTRENAERERTIAKVFETREIPPDPSQQPEPATPIRSNVIQFPQAPQEATPKAEASYDAPAWMMDDNSLAEAWKRQMAESEQAPSVSQDRGSEHAREGPGFG